MAVKPGGFEKAFAFNIEDHNFCSIKLTKFFKYVNQTLSVKVADEKTLSTFRAFIWVFMRSCCIRTSIRTLPHCWHEPHSVAQPEKWAFFLMKKKKIKKILKFKSLCNPSHLTRKLVVPIFCLEGGSKLTC